jgi:acyl-CoA reductase-like NAD-dependent aldehyde dehydrogenase
VLPPDTDLERAVPLGMAAALRNVGQSCSAPTRCVIPCDLIDDAVRIANVTVYGLGAHVQSAKLERARAVARRIRSGQVLINNPAWDPFAPFGGYKQSGNGREYGAHGISEYLETKRSWDTTRRREPNTDKLQHDVAPAARTSAFVTATVCLQ